MINFEISGKVCSVPSAWGELTQMQYIALAPLLFKFSCGELSLDEVKVQWLISITRMHPRDVNYEDRDSFTRNLILLADNITFFYNYVYRNGLESVSEENRRFLKKHHPDTLPDSPEIVYMRRQECEIVLDAYIDRNLIPELHVGTTIVPGWTAEQITAGAFLSCLDLIVKLPENPAFTNKITEILYQGLESNDIDESIHYAILFNFQAFANYIFKKTRFAILFRQSRDRRSTKSLSTNIDQLYSLCKKGYGSSVDIEEITVLQYLTILINELFESARIMRCYDKSVVEIADSLNITVEEVLAIC